MLKGFYSNFIFGCSGFLWLHRLFSGCGEWGLLSSVQAALCNGFSLQSVGWRVRGLQELWLPGSRAQTQ